MVGASTWSQKQRRRMGHGHPRILSSNGPTVNGLTSIGVAPASSAARWNASSTLCRRLSGNLRRRQANAAGLPRRRNASPTTR